MACDTRLRDLPHRWEVKVGVVLGDQDEEEGRAQARQAANREVKPSHGVLGGVEQQAAEHHDADGGERHGDLVPTLQDLHGVHVLALGCLRHHDADPADNKVHGVDCEREENVAALHVRRQLPREAPAQDHGRQDLAGNRLKQVGATAGAVADVVSDEIRDDGGVPRVVLRDIGLHLAHHVRTDVGGLGVDAPAELREERDEGGAEAVAHEQERQLVQVRGHQHAHAEEQGDDAQQHHGDDEHAAEAASTEPDCHGLLEGPGCRG
mmetsp:Transcript_104745/g.291708  ORF Transcript_104745/g.291708 Transcript_104745/m.291708 type:complete len:265 (+) Transcript_104745:1124-1918(+)